MSTEVEIKLALAGPEEYQRLLDRLGEAREVIRQHNVFFDGPDGEIGIATERGIYQTLFARTHAALEVGKWHTLELNWDCVKGVCAIALDGRHLADMPQLSRAEGVCYLRLWMQGNPLEPEGMLVESVQVRVEP